MTKSWAVTVRKHAKKTETITETDYNDWIQKAGPLLQYHVFEEDKGKPHVHLHGILNLPVNYFKKKLTLKGYNTKIVEIFDLQGWLEYCKKDLNLRTKVIFECEAMDIAERIPDSPLSSASSEPGPIFKRNLFKK